MDAAADTFSDEVTEKSLNIQGQDKILALHWALPACENDVYDMGLVAREGIPKGNMSENDIKPVLHTEKIWVAGDWIKTLLSAEEKQIELWFQECELRQARNNEISAFYTVWWDLTASVLT